jgi:DNA polymerase III epsilon subunit-like protein
MVFIFLDLETTGVPTRVRGQLPSPTQVRQYDQARITEICFIVTDDHFQPLKIISSLIKPDGFVFSARPEINNIDYDNCVRHGTPLLVAMDEVMPYLENKTTLVSYNIEFDLNILLSEFHRAGRLDMVTSFSRARHVCIMKMVWPRMSMQKYPRLTEAYEFLFHEPLNQRHRAQDDAEVCRKCYLKLIGFQPKAAVEKDELLNVQAVPCVSVIPQSTSPTVDENLPNKQAPQESNFESMTKEQLVALCRKRKLHGYSRLKKNDLVGFLQKNS